MCVRACVRACVCVRERERGGERERERSHIRIMHVCLAVTCHSHFWQNDRGSFMCYCGNTGVERIPKKESAQKVDSGEENSPVIPAGTRTRNLSITNSSLFH